MSDSNDRLDSWKTIAEYLNRDVRTLRRWEQQGLPVRRVPGGRGNSVFAFRAEIDAWLKEHEPGRTPAPPQTAEPQPAPAPIAAARPQPVPPLRRAAAAPGAPRIRYAAAALIILVAIVGWKAWAPAAARQQISARLTPTGIVATSADGTERWRYDFPPDVTNIKSEFSNGAEAYGGQNPMVLAMSSFLIRRPEEISMSGVLRSFSIDGKLQGSFTFDDTWSFHGRSFGEPWAMTDFRVDDSFGRRQIAVSAHHYMWWPGAVAVLDGRMQRVGTFVNSGWVDSIRWFSPDRLAISGFNQALDGGMFAMLDSHDVDGASPEKLGSEFACDNCRGGRPLFYAVFPRSEVNRITASPFNRAIIEVQAHGIVAHTYEMEREIGIGLTEAIYEFSPTLELTSATYGSRYWDKHRALEMQGKINHSRETCPERDGPPAIKVWTREAGWTDVRPKR